MKPESFLKCVNWDTSSVVVIYKHQQKPRFKIIIIPEAKDLLRQWRESNERRSEDVMELWSAVLSEDLDKLGNESKNDLLTHNYVQALKVSVRKNN